MTKRERQYAVPCSNGWREPMLKIVPLVDDHEVEDRKSTTNQLGDVLFEGFFIVAQIQHAVRQPWNLLLELVTQPAPRLLVVLVSESKTKGAQSKKEIAAWVYHGFSDEGEQILACNH